METIPCPGCRTALDPSATVCPICLRPRGKLEITRAYSTLREIEKQRKQRPFVIAGRLLAAGAAGWVLFRFHAPILNAGSFVVSSVSRFADESLYPPPPPKPAVPLSPEAAERGNATASSGDSASPPSFPAAAGMTAAPRAEAPPAPPASPAAPKPPKRPAHVEDLPLPPFEPTSQWVFYGRVFDLITLRPVPDAELTFTVSGGQRIGAPYGPRSDADGRFATVLHRLTDGNSYEIRASRSGYATSVLYESDIPYATLPLSERQEMARNAQDGDMRLPPLDDVADQESIRRDIFLAPRR